MGKPIVAGGFESFRVLVDPDDESRKPGPVTVYVMTTEQQCSHSITYTVVSFNH
jgi:hypothetical protein